MLRLENDIREIANIPSTCITRYLPISCHGGLDALSSNGVLHCGLAKTKGNYQVARRNPDFHILLFTTGGSGVCKSPGRQLTATRGDLLIMPAHCPHHFRVLRAPWKIFWFFFDPKVWIIDAVDIEMKTSRRFKELEWLLGCCYSETVGNEEDHIDSGWHLCNLILRFVRDELKTQETARNHITYKRLNHLIKCIDSRLDHPWTLQEMAAELCMCQRNTTYWVKKYLGTTPMRLVMRLRMQRAAQLLAQTDYKVHTVSRLVGYGNQFAFSVAFRRYHNKSPREFVAHRTDRN